MVQEDSIGVVTAELMASTYEGAIMPSYLVASMKRLTRTAAVWRAALAVLALTGCAGNAPVVWADIKNSDRPSAIERYLRSNPESPHADAARARLVSLKEQADREAAQRVATIEAYRKYLALHADAPFADVARREIARITATRSFQTARKTDTGAAYENFLAMHPQSGDAGEARRALQRVRERDVAARAAKSAHIEVIYRANGVLTELPPPIQDAIHALLRHAALPVVDKSLAELLVTIAGESKVGGLRWAGTIRSRALATYEGVLTVRHGGGFEFKTNNSGRRVDAPQAVFVRKYGPNPQLNGSLTHIDAIEASGLLHALAKVIHSLRGAGPLAAALTGDSPLLAAAAESVLRNHDASGQTETLRALLTHPDPAVQRRAVRALETRWRPDSGAGEAERLSFYFFATWDDGAIISMHEFGVASLARAEPLARASGESKERATMLLSALGHSGVAALVGMFKDGYRGDSIDAAFVNAGDAGKHALLPLLKDPKEHVRREASVILAKMGAQEAIDHLKAQSRKWYGREIDSPIVRRAEALVREVRRPDRYTALIADLDNESDQVSESAATKLGWLGDRRAIKALAAAQKARPRHPLQSFQLAIRRLQAYGR